MSRLTIADKRLEFCIKNKDAFNKLYRSMSMSAHHRPTRSNISSSFSCKFAQFLLIVLFYVDNPEINYFILNYDTIPKKSEDFRIISGNIGSYIYKLFMNLSPRNNPVSSNYANFNEITELTNLDCDLFIRGDNYVVYPLCIYSDKRHESDYSDYTISHYFTLIYDIQNKKNYINSSYGIDEDPNGVPNITIEIDEEYFILIMNIFSNRSIKTDQDSYNEARQFVRIYFLPEEIIDEDVFNKEMSKIRESRIGIINNYTNIIDIALRDIALRTRDRDRTGGKKYKKIKTRKIKTRKIKTRKIKTKKIKTRKIKTIKRLKKAKKSKSKA
jgi:hypothetical protein